MPTHYEVLGVSPDADTETIRRAYVAVAKASHPDRRQNDDPDRRAQAGRRIRAANAAWNVLRDPGRRRDYDLSLPGPGRSTSGAATARNATTSSRSSAASTGASRPTGLAGARPVPPSGHMVPAEHAGFWRFAPIAIVVVVAIAILVVSAYATAGDDATAPSSVARAPVPEVGDCVLVASLSVGRVPVLSPCGNEGARVVSSITDTPRPCPPGTQALPLSDQKTTLCLSTPS